MGRAFEFRKDRKFKRWDKMSKAFTRLGREIAMSVKSGGITPDTNPRLRAAIQNAKAVNMPKERIESAIKRASAKDAGNFEEVVYEGYAPHGVAILVETATDNIMRTVANVRMYFNRGDGALGKTGSLDFIFDRKGVFKLASQGLDPEELELDLIDFGAEEVFLDDETNEIHIYVPFTEVGTMRDALEEKGLPVVGTELVRLPNSMIDVSTADAEGIYALIERIEEDDDVQAVFHNLREIE